jgi:hypothetical protein
VPLTLGSELVYRGSHFDDSEALFRAGDAVYLNAQMSYRISPALQVYLRGENLTDDRTPEVFSFGARGAAVFAGVRGGAVILYWFPSYGLGIQGEKLLLHVTRLASPLSSLPARHHSSTGILPMLGLVDIAAFDQVVVNIIQFLTHQLTAGD